MLLASLSTYQCQLGLGVTLTEKLQSEELKATLNSSSLDGLTTITSRKTTTLFRVKDASGNERTYHSLDELPPEIRAAFERAQDKKKG